MKFILPGISAFSAALRQPASGCAAVCPAPCKPAVSPRLSFVCIICMLPSYLACASGTPARQELERAMELFRTCRKPSHRVQSKHHRSAAYVWGKMPRSDRNVLETNIDLTCTFPRTGASCAAERLRVIKGAMQNGIYLSLRVTAGRRPAGSG